MMGKILDTLIEIFKAKETKEFAGKSVENMAKICMTGDIKSTINEAVETGKYIGNIKDVLFWNKIKKWLRNTCDSPDMEAKLSSKFTEDELKYKKYTKRQLQFIAQIDEEEKIDYYANFTRAWLLGCIDSSLYFKMSYLLKVFTLEELEYLKDNYKSGEITDVNFYIREFSLYGLIDIVETTNLGNSSYKYSDMAKIFVACGWFDDDSNIPSMRVGLKDLKVENTKTCLEITEF